MGSPRGWWEGFGDEGPRKNAGRDVEMGVPAGWVGGVWKKVGVLVGGAWTLGIRARGDGRGVGTHCGLRDGSRAGAARPGTPWWSRLHLPSLNGAHLQGSGSLARRRLQGARVSCAWIFLTPPPPAPSPEPNRTCST